MPFIYPTSVESMTIEPDLVRAASAGRLGLQIMPVRGVNAAKVRWTQQDNYTGLQQLRGMDGKPTHVNRVGEKAYEYEPGVFGEFVDVTETELTNRAGSTDVNSTPIDVEDLIVNADNQLIQREADRQESSVWTLLTMGIISITLAGPNGTQVGYRDSYPIQTYVPLIPWATLATATPIRNFQTVATTMGQSAGHSVDFGAGATAYMNSVTANNLLNNQNAADLNGRRLAGGATINTLADVRSFLIGQNLPQIATYDAGYVANVGGNFQKFIPDNYVVLIGRRPSGALVGNYIVTRNASANYQPRPYRYVKDYANGVGAPKRTPANIEVHRGHNGGPAIYYPSSVIVMKV